MSAPMTTPAHHWTTPRRGLRAAFRAAAVCVAVLALPGGHSAAGAPRPPNAAVVVRQMLFTASLERFITVADSTRRDPRLDWTSDGCSAPVVGSTGASFDFTAPCRRHDFGYRNLQRLDGGRHWSEATRRRIDEQFRDDMRDSCHGTLSMRSRCLAWSEVFYRSVRIFSGR